MASVTREDLLSLLATRHEMVEYICDGMFDKKQIEDGLDVSRPTVDRAFREMEEYGLLTSTGTTYELTRFGRLCCETCGSLLEEIDEKVGLATVLSHLPESASLDDRLLDDAEVIQVETYAPLTPISEIGTFVAEADYIVGYSNAILPYYVEFFHRRVLEEGLKAQVLLPTDVLERAVADYREKLEVLLDARDFELVVTTDSLPYDIVTVDDQLVGVAIRDQNNRLQGALVNRTDSALEWATERLDALLTSGQRLESLHGDYPVQTE